MQIRILQNWPTKVITPPESDLAKKKNKNYRKKIKRRTRKTRRDAKKALESGAVVILVQQEIPPGAIAVLGKGLGYVPMPTNYSSDERLQMRRPMNRILTESRKRCREEHAEQCSDELPSQLRTISYNLGEPAPDRQVNTIVDRLVRTHHAKLLDTKKKSKSKSKLI